MKPEDQIPTADLLRELRRDPNVQFFTGRTSYGRPGDALFEPGRSRSALEILLDRHEQLEADCRKLFPLLRKAMAACQSHWLDTTDWSQWELAADWMRRWDNEGSE